MKSGEVVLFNNHERIINITLPELQKPLFLAFVLPLQRFFIAHKSTKSLRGTQVNVFARPLDLAAMSDLRSGV